MLRGRLRGVEVGRISSRINEVFSCKTECLGRIGSQLSGRINRAVVGRDSSVKKLTSSGYSGLYSYAVHEHCYMLSSSSLQVIPS